MQRALLLVATLLVAGCVQSPVETAGVDVDTSGATGLAAVVSATASGAIVPVSDAFADLRLRVEMLDFDSPEPTIGVTSDGSIFIPGPGAGIMRSQDGGRTWEDVTDDGATGPKANLDPWIFVDPITDRVFLAPLYVACTHLSWSDDLGASWENNPAGGCGLPAHDHQKVVAGPPAEGVTTDGYPNVVYYAYNGAFRGTLGLAPVDSPLDGTWVSRSLDGGRTFDLGRMVIPADPSGINAPPHVASDGTVYLASTSADGVVVAVSRDSGGTWELAEAGHDVGSNPYLAVNPNVATDASGNAYLVWPGEDALMYMSVSRDAGRSWSPSVRVSPPSVTSTAWSVLVAGADGVVTVAYAATDADTSSWETPQAQDAAPDTRWHMVMSTTLDGLAADPAFTTVRVSAADDPIQVGCIWLSGGGEECRNLLDFIGIVQHEGRIHLVYPDGCPEGCKDGPERSEFLVFAGRPSRATVAIVESGPSVLDPAVRLTPLG